MKITIKIHPHNNEELQQLAGLLSGLTFSEKKKKDQPATQSVVTKPQPAPAPAPASTAKPVVTKPQPIEAEVIDSGLTLDSLREKTKAVIQAGKRDEVKKLLDEYSVPNVMSLPKDKYSEYLEKLQKLG